MQNQKFEKKPQDFFGGARLGPRKTKEGEIIDGSLTFSAYLKPINVRKILELIGTGGGDEGAIIYFNLTPNKFSDDAESKRFELSIKPWTPPVFQGQKQGGTWQKKNKDVISQQYAQTTKVKRGEFQ